MRYFVVLEYTDDAKDQRLRIIRAFSEEAIPEIVDCGFGNSIGYPCDHVILYSSVWRFKAKLYYDGYSDAIINS